MLMFVPTANMHDAATGPPGVTMISVLPRTLHQQQPVSQLPSQNTPPGDGVNITTSHNSDKLITASTEQPLQPAKYVRIIV